jgi:pantoate--beta-alanine ligase
MTTLVNNLLELRVALGADQVGLVPTMGALHEGHISLIQRSADENARTVVSVFINPTQFNDPADLAAYPRDFERDYELATKAGAELIYAPHVTEVYPAGFATSVEVAGLADRWEGEARPGHFKGVATVVTVLLNSVRPARSYFGEKDFQQLVIVRRLHRDLTLPGEIVGCPTVRDGDGLALSSRNARLSLEERSAAIVIPRALFRMAELIAYGERLTDPLIFAAQSILEQEPRIAPDYLAVVDPETLEPIAEITPGARALIAARIGSIRLIDNLELLPPDAS